MAAPGQPLGPARSGGSPQPSGTSPGRTRAAVRRCLLAVTVLHDLDLEWDDATSDPDDGLPELRVGNPDPVLVPAYRLRDALADRDLEDPSTVDHLARWLTLRRSLHHVPHALLVDSVRVVGLPAEHVRHPGPDWICTVVPGGALTLGFGLLADVAPGVVPEDLQTPAADLLGGAGSAPVAAAPSPVPLPAGVLEDLGLDPAALWPAAMARLEELGRLAAARRRRRPRDPLRPLAEADVVTLLASRRFRFELAAEAQTGLAGVVVPMLTRGWVSNSSLDSAFGPAAASATEPEQRGFPRPLLVTEYEVVQVPEGGHPLRYLEQPRYPQR
jgi:hypothetical protein